MANEVCPMNGSACPGVGACAPAIFAAAYLNAGIDPEVDALAEPHCPIVDIVHAAKIAASGLLPFVGGGGPEDEKEDKTKAQRREDIIAAFNLDL